MPAPKSATHARIGEREAVYMNCGEAKTQKSKFASPLFRVRVPSPQNYPMVKRVSSNLVILVSLAQRQVFSWSSYTQGPNSQHQGAMMAGAQIWSWYFSNLPHLQKLSSSSHLSLHGMYWCVLPRSSSICVFVCLYFQCDWQLWFANWQSYRAIGAIVPGNPSSTSAGNFVPGMRRRQ